MEAWLETNSGEKVPISSNFTIGRSQNNALVLLDTYVSRLHALIHRQNKGEYCVVDLSTNGVIINGMRIRQSVLLKDNDVIKIGPYVFIFHKTSNNLEDENPSITSIQSTVRMKTQVSENTYWMLCADIEDFTRTVQAEPVDKLAKLMSFWFRSCKDLIENNGGIVNNYLGDGFLAYWPSPITQPDAIARTLIKLKELRENKNILFRMVVHYGKIITTNAFGDNEENIFGPEVNFIFRMEKLAAVLGVQCLMSKSAADKIKEIEEIKTKISILSCGFYELKGFDGKFEFFKY